MFNQITNPSKLKSDQQSIPFNQFQKYCYTIITKTKYAIFKKQQNRPIL